MSNNNNSGINLNSPEISNSKAYSLYFKRIGELTKQIMKRRREKMLAWWGGLTMFQKIFIIIILIGIPIILFYVYFRNKIVINRHLSADKSELVIKNNLPFIGLVDNDDNFREVLTKYLKVIYPSMLKRSNLNYVVPSNQLRNDLNGEYTYSFWIYITGNEAGLYSYFVDQLSQELRMNVSLKPYSFGNFRFRDFKAVMHRGDDISGSNVDLNSINQYPGFWLGPNLTNLYVVFSNNSNSESFMLENLELNRWINITTTINGNAVSVFRDGMLEITGLVSSSIYLSNIRYKNIYFAGGPSLNGGVQGFPGFLNYFNYYNRVLNPDDIQTLYNNYLPLISSLKKKADQYNIENTSTIDVITNEQTFSGKINVF